MRTELSVLLLSVLFFLFFFSLPDKCEVREYNRQPGKSLSLIDTPLPTIMSRTAFVCCSLSCRLLRPLFLA